MLFLLYHKMAYHHHINHNCMFVHPKMVSKEDKVSEYHCSESHIYCLIDQNSNRLHIFVVKIGIVLIAHSRFNFSCIFCIFSLLSQNKEFMMDMIDKSNLKDPKMDALEDMNFHLCKLVVLSIF